MKIKCNKKAVVEKATIEISLENKKEVIAFKNILSLAESQLYLYKEYNVAEFELINQLRKLL